MRTRPFVQWANYRQFGIDINDNHNPYVPTSLTGRSSWLDKSRCMRDNISFQREGRGTIPFWSRARGRNFETLWSSVSASCLGDIKSLSALEWILRAVGYPICKAFGSSTWYRLFSARDLRKERHVNMEGLSVSSRDIHAFWLHHFKIKIPPH